MIFDFRFYEIWREPEYIERLLDGAWTSFALSTGGGLFGLALGLILAAGQGRAVPAPVRYLLVAYIELVRNTPFIVQLFFVTFGLPLLLDYRWPFEASALLAMVLNFSAYFAEVVRAGIDSVHKGQTEAAESLCLKKRWVFIDVVLPQAIAKVYPSLTSQFIFLFLTTGLISEIGVEDLTWSGRFIADRTFRDFEVFIVLTIMYVAIVFVYKAFFDYVQKKAFPWWASK